METFKLNRIVKDLARMPPLLEALLSGIDDDMLEAKELDGTWTVREVLQHLVYLESHDWLVRVTIILSDSDDKRFSPINRTGFREAVHDQTIDLLLSRLRQARLHNLKQVEALKLSSGDLARTGIHPEFGPVSLAQLLSTWAVHDLSHLNQLTRILAKQKRSDVGPWVAYLGILKQR